MSWINPLSNRNKGVLTEDIAKSYLINQGLVFIDKNVHCRQGEIDLVMQDETTYVFIEVKYRKSNRFGGAIAAITHSKQQKIKHCVSFFLNKKNLNEYNTPCRFDVITLEGDISQPEINWLKNAF